MADREDQEPETSDRASDDEGREDTEAAEGEGTEASKAEAKAEDKPRFGSAVGILGFLLALAGGFWIGQAIQNQDVDWAGYDDHGRYRVDLRGDEPQFGPDDALVTIIEFSDYQCPFCQKANTPLMEVLEDNDDVRLIFKHHPLPMHAQAIPAARAAWAAHQQGKFWPMHEHLFKVNGKVDDIDQVAERMGLDVDRFKRDMLSEAASEALESDRYAASVLGIGSTPHFVINGRHVRGALAESHWERVIELERSEAQVIVDGGVAPAGVYDALMAKAKKKRAKPATRGPDPAKRHVVPVGEGRPSLGPADALVTVIEFSDFQCPFCSRVAPTIHDLPGRHDDVRVVFRQLPLPNHAEARPAAIAALAAHRQGKFWEMHDALFAAEGKIDEDAREDMAESIGLDMDRFRADLNDSALAAMVDEDAALAKELKVSGTPSSFVNGRFLSGAQPAERFDTLIQQEREVAQQLVSEGTAPAAVLDTLNQQAQGS
ncbi:MAG: thioredoxin domain-containing protein [Myxococcota bacterium]